MSPAIFKIVFIKMCLLSGQPFFGRIFIMIQGFEISGVMFTQGCVFSRASLAAFRAKVGFLIN